MTCNNIHHSPTQCWCNKFLWNDFYSINFLDINICCMRFSCFDSFTSLLIHSFFFLSDYRPHTNIHLCGKINGIKSFKLFLLYICTSSFPFSPDKKKTSFLCVCVFFEVLSTLYQINKLHTRFHFSRFLMHMPKKKRFYEKLWLYSIWNLVLFFYLHSWIKYLHK